MGATAATGRPFSLYLHIPFCQKKCPYCDFNTYAGLEALHEDTVDALCAEMERWAPAVRDRPVSTIFMGGGTPTVLPAPALRRLFATLRRCFTLEAGCEITSEANPGTVDRDKFAVLREVGVNRLSLGVQSFQPHELEFLGRIHDVDDVHRAVESARATGFDNLNLDFIFGLPGQRIAEWEATIAEALALRPEHLSLYSLIVEENTPLFAWVESGRVQPPDEDMAADLYEIALARLADAGFAQYEVSNWARALPGDQTAILPQRASRHNLVYWQNGEYLGIGPGAHSHLRSEGTSRRWGNRKPVAGYVNRIRRGDTVEDFHETPEPHTAMGETMMLGLRLVRHGVPFSHFAQLHGADLRTVYAPVIAELLEQGLVELDTQRIRLSERGLLLGNQVFARFLPDDEPGHRAAPAIAPGAIAQDSTAAPAARPL